MSSIRILVTDRDGHSEVVEGNVGGSLMLALRKNGYPLQALCGGAMSCATCHIYVDAAWRGRLAPRSEFERALVEDTNAFQQEASRLSCQIELSATHDGLALTIAPED